MARYCFYCGRELGPTERCMCRDKNRSNQAAGQTNASSPHDSGSSSTRTNSASGSGASGQKNRFYGNAAGSAQAKKTHTQEKSRTKKRTWFSENFNENVKSNLHQKQPYFRGVTHFFHSLFTKPTDILRSTQNASILQLVLSNLLYAISFSLMIFTFVRFSTITKLTVVSEYAAASSLNTQAMISALRGFFAGIVLIFGRYLVSYLVFRIFAHKKMSLLTLARAYLPGTYYAIVVIIFSLLFVSGSGIQSIVMLIASFSLRGLVDYLSVKEYITLPTDRMIFQMQIINLILFIVFSYLISFSVPNLTSFGILPSKEKETFHPNIVRFEEKLNL